MMTEEQYERIITKGMVDVEKYTIPLILFIAGGEITGNCQFATGCLLLVSTGVALITSGHVLHEFSEMSNEGRLQLGENRFVLRRSDNRSVVIGTKTDIGALMLSEEEVSHLGAPVLSRDRIAAKDVRPFELIAFNGYPGATKALIGPGEITGLRHQVIGIVETVEHDQFSIRTDADRYDLEKLVPTSGDTDHYPLGGMSGSPVFSFVTGTPHFTVRRRPVIVGWVYEALSWNRLESKIYVVKAAALAEILGS